MKYHFQQDGEWVRPNMNNYRLRCCDCGLVHTLDFRIVDDVIEFRAFRENQATGQTRIRSELGRQIRKLMDMLEKKNNELKYLKKHFVNRTS